jgi:hypothetical protein
VLRCTPFEYQFTKKYESLIYGAGKESSPVVVAVGVDRSVHGSERSLKFQRLGLIACYAAVRIQKRNPLYILGKRQTADESVASVVVIHMIKTGSWQSMGSCRSR